MMRNALCIVFGLLLGANFNSRNNVLSPHSHFVISPDVIKSNGSYWFVLKLKKHQELPNTENFDSFSPSNVYSNQDNDVLKPCWPDDFNKSLPTHEKRYNTSTTGYTIRKTPSSYVTSTSIERNDNVQKVVLPEMSIGENKELSKVWLPTVESQDCITSFVEKSTISVDEWDPITFYIILQDLFQRIPDKYRDVTMFAVSLVLPFLFLVLSGGLLQSRQINKLVGGQNSILIYTKKLLSNIQDIQKDEAKLLLLMNHKSGILNEDIHNAKMALLTFKDEVYSKEKNESENILFKFIEVENKMGGMCNSFVRWCLRNESLAADVKKKLQFMNTAQNRMHSNYKIIEKELNINNTLSSGDTVFTSMSQGYSVMENHESHQVHSITPDTPINSHSKSIWSGGKWFRQSGSHTAHLYSPELTKKRSYTDFPDEQSSSKDIPGRGATDVSGANSMSTVSGSSITSSV